MKTVLDNCFEVLLVGTYYDTDRLVVDVKELFVQSDRQVCPDHRSRKFKITFESPRAHLIVEEFAEAAADLCRGEDTGFLRTVTNPSLAAALGMDITEWFGHLNCYALLTAHEIIFVYCDNEPNIEHLHQ